MNPAPDADVNSVGQENFDWIVNAVAELAVRKAKQQADLTPDYRWSAFLSGYTAEADSKTREKASKPSSASKQTAKRTGNG
jgi:hypothetical protein